MTSTGKPRTFNWRFVRYAALTAALAAALFTPPAAQAQTYSVLHIFTGGADGATPDDVVVLNAAGNLYGTTAAGGSANFGTVFKIDTGGTETTTTLTVC